MTKRKRRVLILAGSVFGIIVLAAAVIVATRDWNKAKAYITAGVSKATGRQFSINGALSKSISAASPDCAPARYNSRTLSGVSTDRWMKSDWSTSR